MAKFAEGKEKEKVEEVDDTSKETQAKSRTEYTLETVNGIYRLKRPSGPVGAKHFSLLTKCIPTTKDESGNMIFSPADNERMANVFEQWSAMVLPKIIIEGPFTPDQVPGEDQYALFLAMFNLMNFGVGPNKDPFRIL